MDFGVLFCSWCCFSFRMRLFRLLVIVVVDEEWLLLLAAEDAVAMAIECCLLLSFDVGVLLGVLC